MEERKVKLSTLKKAKENLLEPNENLKKSKFETISYSNNFNKNFHNKNRLIDLVLIDNNSNFIDKKIKLEINPSKSHKTLTIQQNLIPFSNFSDLINLMLKIFGKNNGFFSVSFFRENLEKITSDLDIINYQGNTIYLKLFEKPIKKSTTMNIVQYMTSNNNSFNFNLNNLNNIHNKNKKVNKIKIKKFTNFSQDNYFVNEKIYVNSNHSCKNLNKNKESLNSLIEKNLNYNLSLKLNKSNFFKRKEISYNVDVDIRNKTQENVINTNTINSLNKKIKNLYRNSSNKNIFYESTDNFSSFNKLEKIKIGKKNLKKSFIYDNNEVIINDDTIQKNKSEEKKEDFTPYILTNQSSNDIKAKLENSPKIEIIEIEDLKINLNIKKSTPYENYKSNSYKNKMNVIELKKCENLNIFNNSNNLEGEYINKKINNLSNKSIIIDKTKLNLIINNQAFKNELFEDTIFDKNLTPLNLENEKSKSNYRTKSFSMIKNKYQTFYKTKNYVKNILNSNNYENIKTTNFQVEKENLNQGNFYRTQNFNEINKLSNEKISKFNKTFSKNKFYQKNINSFSTNNIGKILK